LWFVCPMLPEQLKLAAQIGLPQAVWLNAP
jgi:hypothetical protein